MRFSIPSNPPKLPHMPTPPASRSTSPARTMHFPSTGSTISAPGPRQDSSQSRRVLQGNGQIAEALHDGLRDTQRNFGEGMREQRPAPPAMRLEPPQLEPLQLDGQADHEDITVYEIPLPRSREEIEGDFAAMRSARSLFQAAEARLANPQRSGAFFGLSYPGALALMELKERISQSSSWQAAFTILERASRRYGINSPDAPDSRGLLLSISDQIDLNRHQASLMRLFKADFGAMQQHLLPPAPTVIWEVNNSMGEDEWPFVETEECWTLRLTPNEPHLALRSSAIQFWGELWSDTTQPVKVTIEKDATAGTLDMIVERLDAVEMASHFKIMRSVQAMLIETADFAEFTQETLNSKEARKSFEILESAHARHTSAYQNGSHRQGLDFLGSEVRALERYRDDFILELQKKLRADAQLRSSFNELAVSITPISNVSREAPLSPDPASLNGWALRLDGQETSVTVPQGAIQFWSEFHAWAGNHAAPVPIRVLQPPTTVSSASH